MTQAEDASGSWGLLGPHTVTSERRTRTLGLAVAVRAFNDLAVPGLGGIWFAKPLVISLLGIAVAGRADRPNIEAANAVEALACRLAFEEGNWAQDSRLRGRTKLRGQDDLSYAKVRRSNFYVTQPMRQATVQPLLALGLVEATGERFNAFNVSVAGRLLLSKALEPFRPYNMSVEALLTSWATGERTSVDTSVLRKALSPINPLTTEACAFVRECLMTGLSDEQRRRRATLAWVTQIAEVPRESLKWDKRYPGIDESHWRDLRVGGRFFEARDAALTVLNAIEASISSRADVSINLSERLPKRVADAIAELRRKAGAFLDEKHDPTPGHLAASFCRECLTQSDNSAVVSALVKRDGRGLLLRGRLVVRGAAFRGDENNEVVAENTPDDDGNETAIGKSIGWPEGMSYRLNNLFLLNLDLQGQLANWLEES